MTKRKPKKIDRIEVQVEYQIKSIEREIMKLEAKREVLEYISKFIEGIQEDPSYT